MKSPRHSWAIPAGLILAVFLWGGNNTGTKFLVQSWPPVLVGGSRFLCAGLLLLALLHWTNWMGATHPCPPDLKRQLWWRGGLALALYIVAFNWAFRFTAASHVALYLGASPVWALLWEGGGDRNRGELLKRAFAAGLAMTGVVILFWPTLHAGSGTWPGECLGLIASVLWVAYGRQCRRLSTHLSGTEITAHTMWRAGVLLLPFGALELIGRPVHFGDARLLGIQLYCILMGGVASFGLWNSALKHWETSDVYLFNNLIPLSTMLWAHFCLGEPMTPTFWLAMAFIAGGVLFEQINWPKLFRDLWTPVE